MRLLLKYTYDCGQNSCVWFFIIIMFNAAFLLCNKTMWCKCTISIKLLRLDSLYVKKQRLIYWKTLVVVLADNKKALFTLKNFLKPCIHSNCKNIFKTISFARIKYNCKAIVSISLYVYCTGIQIDSLILAICFFSSIQMYVVQSKNFSLIHFKLINLIGTYTYICLSCLSICKCSG